MNFIRHLFLGCTRFEERKANDGGTVSKCIDCGEENCYHHFGPIEIAMEVKKGKR